MRAIRLIVVVLLAASLGILPVSAGIAMTHAAKAEMSMSASGTDCPCCNAAKKCVTDHCQFKCFNTPAISVDGFPLAQPVPEPLAPVCVAALSPFSRQLDPPPPRS